MKQSIGTTFLLNFIIVFIIIVFAFLIAIMNYMKAFRVNSGISNTLENHEGYNRLSKEEIDNFLGSFGYRQDQAVSTSYCPRKNGKTALNTIAGGGGRQLYRYCIYEYDKDSERYFKYGIITYIYLDVPIINQYAAIPVYTETEKIYEFNVRPR